MRPGYITYILKKVQAPPPESLWVYNSERGRGMNKIVLNGQELEQGLEILQAELQQMSDEEFDALWDRLERE